MKVRAAWFAGVALALFVAFPAKAQFGMQAPSMRGIWDPKVGAASVYEFDDKEGKRQIQFGIVGTENAGSKTGHWLEMVVQDKKEGEVVMKMLFVQDSELLQVKRMVVQTSGEDPIEMPLDMMGQGRPQKPQKADIREEAELVGTETITVPAGTFSCQHYRMKDKSAEVWVSDKVAPYGLVKAVSKDGNMVLVKVLDGVKSKIRGTPRNLSDMMRQRP